MWISAIERNKKPNQKKIPVLCTASSRHRYDPVRDLNGYRIEQRAPVHPGVPPPHPPLPLFPPSFTVTLFLKLDVVRTRRAIRRRSARATRTPSWGGVFRELCHLSSRGVEWVGGWGRGNPHIHTHPCTSFSFSLG